MKHSYLFFLLMLIIIAVGCNQSKSSNDKTIHETEEAIPTVANQIRDTLQTDSQSPTNAIKAPEKTRPSEQKSSMAVNREVGVEKPKETAAKPVLVSNTEGQPDLSKPENTKPAEKNSELAKVKEMLSTVKDKNKVPPKEQKEEIVKLNPAPSHMIWDELLKKYVSSTGKVNYKGFKSDASRLDEYLNLLSQNPIQEQWTRNQIMAYWINAYNAFTVKLIVNNYPTSSITNLHNGKPWDVKWIDLGGKKYSLNQIENDILRPVYKDPRIHFAVNCAAKSCPPLLNRAWTAGTLNEYFEKQAKAFINNSSFNDIEANAVEISKIFEWYKGDFGDLIAYLNQYANVSINADAPIKYKEYDWALNE